MKKGLILEGGAMRGLFTAGVIDVLMENNVCFDGAIGVSAGAAFGCNYKSGQIGRVVRYNTRFCRDKRFCGLYSLLKTGDIYGAEFCYGEIPSSLDRFDFEAYRENPMKFYVVCTDIETGKPVYHEYTGYENDRLDWIRASASMPLVSNIVNIHGQMLLDVGMSDAIPAEYFKSIGYDRNVAVLTRPLGYRKTENRAMPLIRARYRDYPGLIKAMERRHIMYNSELDFVSKEEAAGHLFVIRPAEDLPVRRVERDPERLRLAYKIGRDEANARLEELIRFLEK